MSNKIIPALMVSLLFASGARAAEFDINGMGLGMNSDQVIAKYQERRPDGQYSFSKWRLPEGTEWVSNGTTLYNDLSRPDDMEHERMNFAFTGLGSGNKLFAVRRELKFRPSERPTMEAVFSAAVQKFGEPSVQGKSATAIWAAWKFAEPTAPAERLKSPIECISPSNFPVGLNDVVAKAAAQMAKACGIYINFTVRGGEAGLANELEMSMIDHLDLVRDYDSDNQDARKRIDAAKATNARNAAPAPRL